MSSVEQTLHHPCTLLAKIGPDFFNCVASFLQSYSTAQLLNASTSSFQLFCRHMKLADVEAILRALNDAEVRYLIVGGLAVVAHVTFERRLISISF